MFKSILNFVKNKYGKASVATGHAFKAYLRNSEIRYNKVKTLADLSEPRTLEGTDGIYVDGTLGGAGHSKEIVKKLSSKGLLIGIDRDEEALKAAKNNLKEFQNVKYVVF